MLGRGSNDALHLLKPAPLKHVPKCSGHAMPVHAAPRGMYVCRTLSFQGALFAVTHVNIDGDMERMYNAAARFWADLKADFQQVRLSAPPRDSPSSPMRCIGLDERSGT